MSNKKLPVGSSYYIKYLFPHLLQYGLVSENTVLFLHFLQLSLKNINCNIVITAIKPITANTSIIIANILNKVKLLKIFL